MSAATNQVTAPVGSSRVLIPRRSKTRRRLPWVAIAIIVVFVLAGVLAPWISPSDPYSPALSERLRAPSSQNWLGTDTLGRDLFTRIIYGARITLTVVMTSLVISALIGLAMGIVSGYYRGWVDSVISRSIDALLSIPTIFIALALAAARGPGAGTVVIAVCVVTWAKFARVVRAEVLALSEQDFVAQAQVTGCSKLRIMLVHILPNITNSFMVLFSINMGYVIMLEASLSFLGAGIPPPTPSWGAMVSEGQNYIANAWWVSLAPGMAIALVVLALNIFGDWLRDYLDPRMRDAL